MTIRPPIAPNFRRRRTTFEVNIEEILGSIRNGLRVPLLIGIASSRETRYLKWLRKVGGTGSRAEWAVFEALERVGLLALQSEPPGRDFEFQVPINGGRARLGGAVVDFVVWSMAPPLAIRVQGEYFHFIDDDQRASDLFERKTLEGQGLKVIDILAQDTLDEQRTDEVVAAALAGFEMAFTGRLQVF